MDKEALIKLYEIANPEDVYDMYIVINRILAEEIWKKEVSKKFERNSR